MAKCVRKHCSLDGNIINVLKMERRMIKGIAYNRRHCSLIIYLWICVCVCVVRLCGFRNENSPLVGGSRWVYLCVLAYARVDGMVCNGGARSSSTQAQPHLVVATTS